jgi:hypothetical protein
MNGFPKYVLILAVPILMAIVCFIFSTSEMSGLQDCRDYEAFWHTISVPPRPSNCADFQTVMSRDIFYYIGTGFLLSPLGIAIIWIWRQARTDKYEIQSIKMSEL